MKISLVQLNYHIGNFEYNADKIIKALQRSKQEGADLVVFSELAVCGYSPLDRLEQDDFIKKCEDYLNLIARECKGISAIIGTPSINNGVGKRLFNSACFISEGEIKSLHHKVLLPNYDVFDEYRYFEPARAIFCIDFKGCKIALPICEDLWNIDENPLYIKTPMDELMRQQPDLIINIAASPFSYHQQYKRTSVVIKNAKKYNLPVVYVNQVGANTNLIFDGSSMVVNPKGDIEVQLSSFDEDMAIWEFSKEHKSQEPVVKAPVLVEDICNQESIGQIHKALVLGIRDYFSKSGFQKAILGMSGGIDSAVVLALAVEALGADKVLPVMLPSQYSSGHSVDDSEEMIKNLGCPSEKIEIEPIYQALEDKLSHLFAGLSPNIAEENMQVRIRGVLLMAVSNKFGHILLNTSNKSELSVGYGTLYGDMCGGLSVIGDLYKTQVYALAEYINRFTEIIPPNIIEKAPSAELRPDQKDSDSLPDYAILDKILYHYIDLGQGHTELQKTGISADLIHRIVSLTNNNEYKRFQFAPVLRVSAKAFGSGRRMPIVAKY